MTYKSRLPACIRTQCRTFHFPCQMANPHWGHRDTATSLCLPRPQGHRRQAEKGWHLHSTILKYRRLGSPAEGRVSLHWNKRWYRPVNVEETDLHRDSCQSKAALVRRHHMIVASQGSHSEFPQGHQGRGGMGIVGRPNWHLGRQGNQTSWQT
jgi:hypothetical protein